MLDVQPSAPLRSRRSPVHDGYIKSRRWNLRDAAQSFDIKAMVERKPGTVARLPLIEPSPGLERSVLAQIRKIEHEMARAVRELIVPAYERQLAASKDLLRDADEETFGRVRFLIQAMVRAVTGQVKLLLELEGQRHTKSWMASARKTFGVNLASVVKVEDLEAYLAAAALRNAGLIQGLSDDLIKRVQQETTTALIAGESASKLKQRIKKQLGISDSRARLIARDQTSKLTSDLNRIRHEQAGIEEYIWRTSQDERVRQRHKGLEGKRYRYGQRTGAEEGLPPGQPIQCRCVAQAIVEF